MCLYGEEKNIIFLCAIEHILLSIDKYKSLSVHNETFLSMSIFLSDHLLISKMPSFISLVLFA